MIDSWRGRNPADRLSGLTRTLWYPAATPLPGFLRTFACMLEAEVTESARGQGESELVTGRHVLVPPG